MKLRFKKDKKVTMIVGIIALGIVALSSYLLFNYLNKPEATQVLNPEFEKYLEDENVTAEPYIYTEAGFNKQIKNFVAKQKMIVLIENRSDKDLVMRITRIPAEYTGRLDVPAIQPGETGEIELDKEGLYTIENTQNKSHYIEFRWSKE